MPTIQIEKRDLESITRQLDTAKNMTPAGAAAARVIRAANESLIKFLDEAEAEHQWPNILADIRAASPIEDETEAEIAREYRDGYNLGWNGGQPDEDDSYALKIGFEHACAGWDDAAPDLEEDPQTK